MFDIAASVRHSVKLLVKKGFMNRLKIVLLLGFYIIYELYQGYRVTISVYCIKVKQFRFKTNSMRQTEREGERESVSCSLYNNNLITSLTGR